MPRTFSEIFFDVEEPEYGLNERLAFIEETPEDRSMSEIFFDVGEKRAKVKREIPEPSQLWDDLPDVFKKGYNESLTGMAQQLATGEAPFDLENYHPGVLGDIGAALVSFFMPADFLTFAAGAGIGGQAAKMAGKTALKQMMRAGVNKKFAEKTLEKGMATLAGKAGLGAGTGAGALGVYSGVADALSQEIETNNIDWGQVSKSVAKGAALGAITGAVGGRAAYKGSSEAVRVAQEIASFGVAQPALDLRMPTPQDFLHAGGMILGIRGGNLAFRSAKRLVTGQPIIKPKAEYKEASPEFIEETAKEILKQRKAGEVWTSKREGFESVEIKSERTTKDGIDVFGIKNIKTGKTVELARSEFFKEFDLFRKALSPEEIAKKRIGEIAGLSKKLTSVEYGFSNQFLKDTKFKITGNQNISTKDMNSVDMFKYRKALRYEKDLIDLKKELKPSLVEIQPGKTLFERLFPENLIQPALASETRLKSREGVTLGRNWIPEADAHRAEILGTFVKEAVFDSGLRTFKKPELIADALEAKPGQRVNPEAKVIADKVRESMDKAFKLAEDVGIDVSGYIEGYFPRMMKKDIQKIIFDDLMPFFDKYKMLLETGIRKKSDIETLNRIIESSLKAGDFSNTTNKAFQKLVKEGKLSYKEALDSLRNEVFSEMYSPFGNLEKARKLELPADFYERNAKEVITRYLDKFARRISSAKYFGVKGEKANALLEALRRKNPKEHRILQELYTNYTGLSSVDPSKILSPAARKLAENVMSFEYATKIGLGFATIPNITQFSISTAVETGYWRFFRGAYHLLKKDVRDRIIKSGATHHNVMDILLGTDMGISHPTTIAEGFKKLVKEKGSRMTNVANLLSTLSGFKGINWLNQMLAASTAEVFVKDLHNISKGKGLLGQTKRGKDWARRNLEKLGIKDYKKVELSDRNIEHAMYRFAKESQLQKDILKDPLAFNNAKMRPFFIFKRFGYRQAKYMKDLMKRELQMGNVFVPIRLAIGGYFGAGFVNRAKDWLIKFWGGEDVVREDKEGFADLADAMSVVGSMGFFSDILEAENTLGAISFAVTPVMFSDIFKAWRALEGLEYNIENWGLGLSTIARTTVKALPIFGGVPKQISKRLETKGLKEGRISAEKGRTRTKVFDLMLEGKDKQAYKLINNWNKNRPTNPLTYDDIDFIALYKYVVGKEKVKAKP
jgi:hypothetical protein